LLHSLSDRIARVAEGIHALGADALVVSLPSQVLLLTGYWPIVGTAIAIVTAEGQTYLIAPEDEAKLAERATVGRTLLASFGSMDHPTRLEEDVAPYLKAALHQLGLRNNARIAVDRAPHSEQAPYVAFTVYGCAIEAVVSSVLSDCAFVNASELLWNTAAVLTTSEIEVLRRAALVARQAYERGASEIKPGITEIQASMAIEGLLTTCALSNDGGDRAFGHIACMSGKNSGIAYGAYARSSRKTLASNELVLTHCNSTLSGYWTDVTRTYHIGEPPARVRKMYEALLAASRAGIATVKPGVHASDVDRAVRSSLEDDGFGEQFKHGTGHGVGFAAIDHRAKPRLRPNSPDVIEPGMVFNIEPGIYYEDFGGMRNCDMVLCTDSGAELLTPFQRTIEELLAL
jgi:Xaa-Pro aminopeptidase